MNVDLAIVGSGAAGFAAAIAARRRGLSVVMVERQIVGGTCVNTGCVPSKALLAAAEARHSAAVSGRFPGVAASAGSLRFAGLIAGKDELVGELRAGKYVELAAELGWEILAGSARFEDGPSLWVDGADVRVLAQHYLIATGSAPWKPDIAGVDGVALLTSATAMDLAVLPKSMLIIGGNYIGLEQGQLFARLGVEVTVVESRERMGPDEEPEVSAVIARALSEEGLRLLSGTEVRRLRAEPDEVVATVVGGDGVEEELRADRVLLATGRRPVVDGLGLGRIGVGVGAKGEVVVDEHLRTAHPRVWAAGDVTGHPAFVYVAAAEGALVVENAFGDSARTLDYRGIPRVTFTSPAIASAGFTEAQAAERGLDCESRVLPLGLVPRAIVNRDTRGLVKLVAERGTGRLVGAHVVADGAGEVIAAAEYALRGRLTVADVAELWCPYLTMAEGLKLAAQTFARDVTKLSCCAS